jgi:hypothetical protein
MSRQIVGKKKNISKKKVIHNFPPSIDLAPIQTMTFRFVAGVGAGLSSTIYRRNLLCLIMSQNVNAILGSIFESVRLKKVEIWGASVTSDINFSTVSLEWEDPRGNTKIITDSGTVNKPAHIVCKPPKESTVAMWSNFNTTYVNEPLFFISYGAGSIIDVTINFSIGNGTTNNASIITRTTASATIGLYYLNLDNSNAAGNNNGGTILIPPPSVLTVLATS